MANQPQLMKKRALLYARVSGDDRRNATSSIQSQLADCLEYADQRGYTVVGEFFEEPNKATSGADWLPELEKIIRLAPSRTFDVLVCREVDRLARNRLKQLATEVELESHGVVVEYAIGQFEDSDEGRLLKGLVSEFAEYERGKIRRRTQNGRLRSVEAGNINIGGSGAPYGYNLEMVDAHRTLRINEQEAAVVRLMFEKYASEGYSLYQIGKYLDSHKIPLPTKANNHKRSRKRSTWTVATICRLLGQETYVGRWHYRKTRFTKDPKTGKVRNVPRPREEWLEVSVPAIVTEELFKAVRKRRQINKHQMGHQRKHTYCLGGMIQCGRCGTYVSGTTKTYKKSEYSYYKCNAHHKPREYSFRCDSTQFKVSSVETSVWGWIKSLLLEPAVLRKALEDHKAVQRKRVQPQLAMLESTQARLTELDAQKTRLIDAYTKGVLTLDELASQKTTMDKQIADLGQVVTTLRTEAEPFLITDQHIQTIETIAAEVRQGATIADTDPLAQREIYRILEVNVLLNNEGKKRWADVSCNLGSQRCAVEFSISGNSGVARRGRGRRNRSLLG